MRAINETQPRGCWRGGLTMAAMAFSLFAVSMGAPANPPAHVPTLPSPLCDKLEVPEGNQVAFHAYALGVQIYRWDGSAWVFVAPSARLFSDPGHHGQVGTHYAGPTWESNSGSKVAGARLFGCTPDASPISWLPLSSTAIHGPGVFEGVTYIQRVNTAGGIAPAAPGTVVGQTVEVPYTAEYIFYRATD